MHPSTCLPPKSWLAFAACLLACGVPMAAGIAVFVDPARQLAPAEWVTVASLSSLPADGSPQRVPVRIARADGWTRLSDEEIGCVFLSWSGDADSVHALQASYHAGSAVEYDAVTEQFDVPCWSDITFERTGRRLHSVAEWGDMRPVRARIADGQVDVHRDDVLTSNR